MTDEELAAELTPDDPSIGLRAISTMTPQRRAIYVQMIETAAALNRHQAGLEPMPPGVIACGPKQIRRAGRE
jgi:hypothetical protein